MKKLFRPVLFCIILLGAVNPVFAQRRITIKLASLVPENTPWGSALNRMAREWSAATNGEVTLQIYHNGVAGGEQDVLRKLKQNQIQAAIFSSIGMSSIAPEIMTLSVPFLIRTNAELDMVLTNLKGDLEKKIDDAGFFPLAWARAGWVKVFSKNPVFVPADLKRMKLGTSADGMELMQAFKAMGYQMVPVETNDILIALNGGMIDAIYQSPIAVGSMQIFGVTKNMASINVAPFMGGMIVNRTAWRSVPDRYKPKLTEIAKRIEREMDTSIMQLEETAVSTMTGYGLRINQVNPEQAQLWYADVERALPTLLGTTFDRDLYGKINLLLRNYRNGR
jgi:TRAP-type C4-dicarboxylate transport system substrate-binding protein